MNDLETMALFDMAKHVAQQMERQTQALEMLVTYFAPREGGRSAPERQAEAFETLVGLIAQKDRDLVPKLPVKITEEDGTHEKWYETRPKTVDELADVVTALTTRYSHDYGTICHAIAAAAIAAARCVDASPQGGITGFQASAVMWEFIRNWMGYKSPLRLVQFEHLLFPQYARDFRSISKSTWEWAQKRAAELLADEEKGMSSHPDVVAHWKNIIAGEVPFGLQVTED